METFLVAVDEGVGHVESYPEAHKEALNGQAEQYRDVERWHQDLC